MVIIVQPNMQYKLIITSKKQESNDTTKGILAWSGVFLFNNLTQSSYQ